jgi:predicted ATPase
MTLQRAQMIRKGTQTPEREYTFKHHLTQEAVYNGLLRRERRAYHRQVAEALEQLYSERLEGQLGLLAQHWDRAEEPQRAIPYLLRAGEHARTAYANEEAIAHFQRALAQLDRASIADMPLDSEAEAQAARLKALRGLGIIYLVTGRIVEAEQHLREAVAVGDEIEESLRGPSPSRRTWAGPAGRGH